MIDLHMHTKYSDGTDDVIDILKKAEKHKLDVISITDHNTCEAYKELQKIDIKKYYSGKIIKGIELNTKILNIPIEILGYGIDVDKMNKITKKEYPTAKERNLFISGGSDYHGTFKPGFDMAVGLGKLKIPNEIVKPWKNMTKLNII